MENKIQENEEEKRFQQARFTFGPKTKVNISIRRGGRTEGAGVEGGGGLIFPALQSLASSIRSRATRARN